MTKTLRRAALVAIALSAVAAGTIAPTAFADGPNGLNAVGLVGGNSVVRFGTQDTRTSALVPVTGLGRETLVGIDFRPRNGLLYGLGSGAPLTLIPPSPAVLPGIFTINPTTGVATRVGQLSVALTGTFFGVDFNPVSDALRVISDTGQNLRQPFQPPPAPPAPPNTGPAPVGATMVDTALNYPAVPGPPANPATGVTGAAYTNNDNDTATGTQLFDIDTNRDQLALQNPPNAGTLIRVGPLGRNVGPNAGFDIFNGTKDGNTVRNAAFAVVTVGGAQRLVTVDLGTGDTDDVGAFDKAVTDLAIELNQNPN